MFSPLWAQLMSSVSPEIIELSTVSAYAKRLDHVSDYTWLLPRLVTIPTLLHKCDLVSMPNECLVYFLKFFYRLGATAGRRGRRLSAQAS